MSTQLMIFKNEKVEIQLDERSCNFDLDIIIEDPVLDDLEDRHLFLTAVSKMTAEQVHNMAVRIVGPLMYYEDPDDLMKKLRDKLSEGGYL